MRFHRFLAFCFWTIFSFNLLWNIFCVLYFQQFLLVSLHIISHLAQEYRAEVSKEKDARSVRCTRTSTRFVSSVFSLPSSHSTQDPVHTPRPTSPSIQLDETTQGSQLQILLSLGTGRSWREFPVDRIACADLIEALEKCHSRGLLVKIRGGCNDQKRNLVKCLRQEVCSLPFSLPLRRPYETGQLAMSRLSGCPFWAWLRRFSPFDCHIHPQNHLL